MHASISAMRPRTVLASCTSHSTAFFALASTVWAASASASSRSRRLWISPSVSQKTCSVSGPSCALPSTSTEQTIDLHILGDVVIISFCVGSFIPPPVNQSGTWNRSTGPTRRARRILPLPLIVFDMEHCLWRDSTVIFAYCALSVVDSSVQSGRYGPGLYHNLFP
jgi:hypothetical protein